MEDNTERNYRLAQYDRRKDGDGRRDEDRRSLGGNPLRLFRARRDGVSVDRRQGQRRRNKRGARRGGIVEELRQLIIKRMVRIQLYGFRNRKVDTLDREIEERRDELKARADARNDSSKSQRDVSRDPSTSVES